MLVGFDRFLSIAAAAQWREDEIDLSLDAAAWQRLDPSLRLELGRLLAGFALAEASVAEQLAPFVSAADPAAAECFRVQAGDEDRHARFFDRVARDVVGVPGATSADRRRAPRRLLDPSFVQLFETRLPEVTACIGRSDVALGRAVGFYNLALEGIVFSAGQRAMLDLLADQPQLPGLRRGVELVLRDERWHVGFGVRCLQEQFGDATLQRWITVEGDRAASAWPSAFSPGLQRSITAAHRRRVNILRAGARA